MLLAVICLLALMMIALSIAIPRIADDIKRDREIETMHRGKQYTRAIQLYYKKFRRYPPNLDALVKTNELRFLRKKYVDPTTGKQEWKPIMLGQNKTPVAMGFFGQPLMGFGGSALAGVGPSGGNGIAGAQSLGGGPSSNGGGGSSFAGGSIFATSGTANTQTTSTVDGSSGAAAPATADSSTGGTDANGNPTSAASGPTFGGAGIIGVSPMSPKASILTYKKKNHYNEWEFVYSPLSEQQSITGGSPVNVTPSAPGVGSPGVPTQPTGGFGTPPPPATISPAPQQ